MDAPPPPDSCAGKRLGRYRLLRLLGSGGMGTVYLAERADAEFRQQVAIKALRPGLEEGEILRRFLVERQTLAVLQHPNIVRVVDGGTTEDGRPYLIMDYVEGVPIEAYANARGLSVEGRLELFRQVCAAVHYAHQNLVVHRDLKPSNILVTAEGVPKLLDFGIAKILAPEHADKAAGLTEAGSQPMTPHYASPEQVLGQPITTATDIYALGVMLYRLLTGQHPYRFTTCSDAELVELVVRAEPERPSDLVRRLTRAAGEAPRAGERRGETPSRALTVAPRVGERQGEALARRLRGDLDMIVMTALRKEPQRRYSSVEHFSEDLRRHLRGLPVAAQRDTLGYRARKFVERHRAGVAAAVVAAVALIASTVVSLEQKGRAERRFQETRELARFVMYEFDDVIRSGVTAARKKMVERALGYLDKLARESSGDISLRRELIEGYFKVGDVQGNLYGPNVGDPAGARESYRRALELARQVHADRPREPASRRDLARAQIRLGDLSALGGDRREALQQYQEALKVLDELAAASPADLTAKRDVLAVAGKIGFTNYQMGHLAAALASYRRGLGIAQEWRKAQPEEPEARRAVAAGHERTGEVLARSGQTAEGMVSLLAALEIYQFLLAARPADAQAQRDVSATHTIIGDILLGAGRTAEAVESYRRGLAITEAVARDDPQNKLACTDLHLTLARLADVLWAAAQKPQAREMTERALRVLRPLAEAGQASDYDLQNYAWILATTPFEDLHDAARAERAALRAVEMNQWSNPRALDTLARAYEAGGKLDRALETEQKALNLLPPPRPGAGASDLRKELEANLARFSQLLGRAPPGQQR